MFVRYLTDSGDFSILDRLPKANYTLLSHLICVLHHVARRSKHNLMCASNLGVCCGPSLLWSPNPSVNQSRAIPTLTEMLIRHCEVLFGEGVTQLFGEERSDSGAEESTDSLHCEHFALSFFFFFFFSFFFFFVFFFNSSFFFYSVNQKRSMHLFLWYSVYVSVSIVH